MHSKQASTVKGGEIWKHNATAHTINITGHYEIPKTYFTLLYGVITNL